MAARPSRSDFVLAALASAGDARFQPVHAQKLFFLLDDRVGPRVGGKYFDFRPYDYGPFDREVYDELNELCSLEEVAVDRDWKGLRTYRVTPEGAKRGRSLLSTMADDVQDSITKYAVWVTGQSFASLVSAIYAAYPAMKVNSVFNG